MSVTYPPDVEESIRQLVESGRYSDPIAVLREAVRLLEESERQRDALRAKLQIGIDQADRGETDEWTPELRERLAEKPTKCTSEASGPIQMSAPSFRLVLTKRAQRDSRSIQLYTLRQWGAEQAIAYDAAIDRAFETLRNNPRIGKVRDEYSPNLMSFPVEHHVLFYRIRKDAIVIVRILHERADPARHLRT